MEQKVYITSDMTAPCPECGKELYLEKLLPENIEEITNYIEQYDWIEFKLACREENKRRAKEEIASKKVLAAMKAIMAIDDDSLPEEDFDDAPVQRSRRKK